MLILSLFLLCYLCIQTFKSGDLLEWSINLREFNPKGIFCHHLQIRLRSEPQNKYHWHNQEEESIWTAKSFSNSPIISYSPSELTESLGEFGNQYQFNWRIETRQNLQVTLNRLALLCMLPQTLKIDERTAELVLVAISESFKIHFMPQSNNLQRKILLYETSSPALYFDLLGEKKTRTPLPVIDLQTGNEFDLDQYLLGELKTISALFNDQNQHIFHLDERKIALLSQETEQTITKLLQNQNWQHSKEPLNSNLNTEQTFPLLIPPGKRIYPARLNWSEEEQNSIWQLKQLENEVHQQKAKLLRELAQISVKRLERRSPFKIFWEIIFEKLPKLASELALDLFRVLRVRIFGPTRKDLEMDNRVGRSYKEEHLEMFYLKTEQMKNHQSLIKYFRNVVIIKGFLIIASAISQTFHMIFNRERISNEKQIKNQLKKLDLTEKKIQERRKELRKEALLKLLNDEDGHISYYTNLSFD